MLCVSGSSLLYHPPLPHSQPLLSYPSASPAVETLSKASGPTVRRDERRLPPQCEEGHWCVYTLHTHIESVLTQSSRCVQLCLEFVSDVFVSALTPEICQCVPLLASYVPPLPCLPFSPTPTPTPTPTSTLTPTPTLTAFFFLLQWTLS